MKHHEHKLNEILTDIDKTAKHMYEFHAIHTSVLSLCDELIKYYPEILTIKYNDYDNSWDDGDPVFVQRMRMAVQIELIRMRLIK